MGKLGPFQYTKMPHDQLVDYTTLVVDGLDEIIDAAPPGIVMLECFVALEQLFQQVEGIERLEKACDTIGSMIVMAQKFYTNALAGIAKDIMAFKAKYPEVADWRDLPPLEEMVLANVEQLLKERAG